MNTSLLTRPYTRARALLYQVLGERISARRPGAVVTLHQHRCGSSVVGRMLGDHPDIAWAGEVLTQDMLRWARAHGTREGWTCDPEQLVRDRMQEAPWGWFGYEVTTHNMNRLGLSCDDAVAMLHAFGATRFVVQERRNHLRRYISSRIAAAAKNWQNKAKKRTPSRIYLDPRDAGMDDESGPLLERLHADTASLQHMLRLTEPYDRLHLVYEDHVEQDPRVAYRMVCEHLGLTPQQVAPPLVRENPFPVRDMLLNYDEVAATLDGTPYEWMLHA